MLKPPKLRLLRITAAVARKLFPKAYTKARKGMTGISPGDLDWFVSEDGHLWTNDTYESHGWYFTRLSGRIEERKLDELEVH